ncbi:MAG: glycosyltransferase family 4 protein [Acidimicrobiales bacterium]
MERYGARPVETPLRVALDLTPAAVGVSGVVRYAEGLWSGLLARDDVTVAGFALGRGRLPGWATSAQPPVRHLAVPVRVVHPAWRWVGHPRAERFVGDVDVVHSMDLVPPPAAAPVVVSVQDVLPATHPQFFSARARRAHAAKLATLGRAAVIVTSTAAAATDIEAVSGIPANRILIAPLGGLFAGPDDEGAGGIPVPPPYVLAVGTLTPRKGFDVLARAMDRLGDSVPPLVIAGACGHDNHLVRAAMADLDRRDRVRWLGSVDDQTLGALYRHATVVCHPSRAEGFGLVCLEAMQAGAPVVATDVPAVREVVGGAAVLVPVDDDEALAAALGDLLTDADRRAEFSAAGRDRGRRFGWERTAATVVDAYRRAATSRR